MKNLLSPLIIVFFSLFLGYVFGRQYEKSYTNLKSVRIVLQRIALLVINPLAFLGAVWIAPLSNLKIIALPFVAAAAILSGGALALLYCRFKKLGRKQTGALIPVGGFTNIGSIGGIVVFFFLGEAAFSLVPIYKLFEELLYYGIGFPLAKSYSELGEKNENRLKELFKDPFIITMLSAILMGLILNITGFNRPVWYAGLNGILIPLATVLLLLSIGMAFHFTSMKQYISHAAAITLIKSLIVPVIAFSLAFAAGLGNFENGLVLKVVLVLSAMPAGFISLVPPTIYDLDIDLANSAWLGTMFSLAYTLPLLALILPFFGG